VERASGAWLPYLGIANTRLLKIPPDIPYEGFQQSKLKKAFTVN